MDTELLRAAAGVTEYAVSGAGEPVTVFAHGITSSIAQTRPFASGVPGTRVFLHFRGHGRSAAFDPHRPWSYDALADELRGVADQVGATRALGVSLGGHALLALLAQTPARFERLVFVIPASLDAPSPRGNATELADAIERRDVERLARMLRDDQPEAVRGLPAVRLWARRRADELAGSGVAEALRAMPGQAPLPDGLAPLAQVDAPALVLAQEVDPGHPVEVAERLAAALPGGQLVVLPSGGVLWRDRARLREAVAGFLDPVPR